MFKMPIHRTRRRRREQGGFALIIIVLLVALLSIVAVSLLDVINLDLVISGQTRQTREARAVADGVTMEMLSHVNIDTDVPSGGWLPTFSEVPDLSFIIADADNGVPPPASYYNFNGDVTRSRSTFASEVRFLRYVPVAETSMNWSRALIYEVHTIGEIGPPNSTAIDSSSENGAEFSRIAYYAPGTLLPQFHAR